MSLAQDIRNAYEGHDNDEMTRLLRRVDALEAAAKVNLRPVELICSRCGVDRARQPCRLDVNACPAAGTVLR